MAFSLALISGLGRWSLKCSGVSRAEWDARPGLPGRLRPRGARPGNVDFELGVDAQRWESPADGGVSYGFLGRATLGW